MCIKLQNLIKIFIILLTILASQKSFGFFSAFESINPSNNGKSKYAPKVVIIKKDSNFHVSVSNIYKDVGWLIKMTEPLKAYHLDFSSLVSGRAFPHGKVVSQKKIYPKNGILDFFRKRKQVVEIKLSAKEMLWSYLFFANSKDTHDGGYYYTIDLPAFLKKYTSSDSN